MSQRSSSIGFTAEAPEERGLSPNTSSRRASSQAYLSTRKLSSASSRPSHAASTRSRSSSKQSRRKRSDEHQPRRLHSSPADTLPRAHIEDAIAFHERSCRLVQSLSTSGGVTSSHYINLTAAPNVAPMIHAPSYTQYDTVNLPTNTNYQSQSEDSEDDEKGELTIPPPEEPTHWTSEATRQEQYAAIDRRNHRLRKLLRKLMPACMSKQTTLDFYDEKDGSDAGSVRRYRLDIPSEGKI